MNTTYTDEKELPLRPCNLKELAEQYSVSTKTLRTWLEPHLTRIGKRRSRYFTALQMRIIYECIGDPLEKDRAEGLTEEQAAAMRSSRNPSQA